jgi:hypothetical protein
VSARTGAPRLCFLTGRFVERAGTLWRSVPDIVFAAECDVRMLVTLLPTSAILSNYVERSRR